MMKKQSWALLALLVPLASCLLPSGGTGSLRIILPSPDQGTSRAISANAPYGNLVRIQLLRNNEVIPIGGKPYLEQGMAGQVVTLDALSPGSGYTIQVATGESEASNFFEVAYFQASEGFEITAGVDADVKVVLKPVPYRLLESTPGDHAVTNLAGHLLYIDGARLISTAGVSQDLTALAGRKVHSLRTVTQPKTPFDQMLFLNTDRGLVVWNPANGGFDLKAMKHNVTTTVDGKDVDTPTDFVTSPEILLSGSFSAVADDGVTNTVYAYGGHGMTAGLAIVGSDSKEVNTVSDLVWDDLDSMLALDENQDIKESLEGAADVVTGFATASTYAWLATALDTYRIDQGKVSGTDELGDDFLDDPALQVKAVLDGRTVPMVVVGAVDGRGYGGTNRGLFTAEVDSNGAVLNGGTLHLIAATKNLKIAKLSAYKHNGIAYAAAYSESTKDLLILKEDVVVARVPGFAGLPRGIPRLAWWVDGTVLTLAIAGDNGTVTYPIQ